VHIAVPIVLLIALLVLGRALLKSGKKTRAPKTRARARRRSAPAKHRKPKPAASKPKPSTPAQQPTPQAAPAQVDLSHLVPIPGDLTLPDTCIVSENVMNEILQRAREVSERLCARRTILSGFSSRSNEPGEMTKLVLSDPALAGQILKTVNSAFYGLQHPVASVFRAVLLLGHVEIRNIIWRNTVSGSSGQTEGPVSDLLDGLWQHSFEVSRAAYAIAKSLNLPEPDEISTAGLLHDVGKIISLNAWPDRFQELYRSIHFGRHRVLMEEIEKLGIDHAALGGEIAQTWGLPPQTGLMITHHHAPSYVNPSSLKGEDLAECRRGLAILHIADILCHSAHGSPADPIYRPKPGWVETLRPVGGLEGLCTESVLRSLPERGSALRKSVEETPAPLPS
jgi:putative nucleotidyltransferase with HDIG domain